MAIYICPNCFDGVSTSEIHKCKPQSKYFRTKIIDDVPEHVKNYGEHDYKYESKNENKVRVWF